MIGRLAVLAIATAVGGGACGTEPPSFAPDAGTCMAYVVPTTTALLSPTVSFKHDVVAGVFNARCSSGVCHGVTGNVTVHGLFLGDATRKGADADDVYKALVGVASTEDPTMDLVAKTGSGSDGDRDSYLMHKIDGDQCLFETSCTDGDCMVSMPSGLRALIDVGERDTVRRWIAQGALDN